MSVSGIAAQLALTQLQTGLSMVKNQAEAQQQVVNLVQEAVDSGARANRVNFLV